MAFTSCLKAIDVNEINRFRHSKNTSPKIIYLLKYTNKIWRRKKQQQNRANHKCICMQYLHAFAWVACSTFFFFTFFFINNKRVRRMKIKATSISKWQTLLCTSFSWSESIQKNSVCMDNLCCSWHMRFFFIIHLPKKNLVE